MIACGFGNYIVLWNLVRRGFCKPRSKQSAQRDSQQQQLAQSIAAALRASARTSDAIGRLGPTAFIILAVDTDGSQAHRLAERLAEAAQPLKFFGGCHGVSNFGTAAIDASELMLRAAAALDRARSEPKGSWLRDFEEVS